MSGATKKFKVGERVTLRMPAEVVQLDPAPHDGVPLVRVKTRECSHLFWIEQSKVQQKKRSKKSAYVAHPAS